MRDSSPSSVISDSDAVLKVTLTGGGPAMERDREDSGKFLDSWLLTNVGSVEVVSGVLVRGEVDRLECDVKGEGEEAGLGTVIPGGCASIG